MSYTIVTAFLIQQNDERRTQDYLNRFEHIRQLKLPTIVFLDKRLHIEESNTLKVVPISFDDLWIYALYKNGSNLPSIRNTQKDTAEYLMIQNSKVEFVYRASEWNPFETSHFLWIDFGLSHVIRNKHSFNALYSFVPQHDIYLSAILKTSHTDLLQKICWRFAGGVFCVSGKMAFDFFTASKRAILEMAPNLTWEVNVWAYIEQQKWLPIHVYYADHNDSILLHLNPV